MLSTVAALLERFPHDQCPKCGAASVPFEGIPDQSLRGCPECEHSWFEDLNKPPIHTTLPRRLPHALRSRSSPRLPSAG